MQKKENGVHESQKRLSRPLKLTDTFLLQLYLLSVSQKVQLA